VVLHRIGNSIERNFSKMNGHGSYLHDSLRFNWIGGLGGFAPHMQVV
jgi:hypothetical protein